MVSDLVTVHAAIGHGNRGRAYDAGRLVGYSEVRGGRTHYHTPEGRGLGHSEVEGSEVVLRENGGRAVARCRRA